MPGDGENDEDQRLGPRDELNEEKGDAEQAPEESNEGGENIDMDNQQKPVFANAFGFNGMNGQFPNMNFAGGDFSQMNQMQMMMAMQNGMAPNGFGFPMMGRLSALPYHPNTRTHRPPGMPGMNMDPSMMNMYQMNGGFGTPGMDMSMMNSGMGGFNGGVGSEENWNGPQSWNNGQQNNYNHPNASGMGNGDYGNFNSGYHTGYNQGNLGPHNQFNDYRGARGGYQFRGRGRGRGGYGSFGRGGYGYGQQQGNYQGQNYMNQQHQQYGSNMMGQSPNPPQAAQNVPSVEGGEGDKSVDEFGRTIRLQASQGGDQQDADKSGEGEGEPKTGDEGLKAEDANGPDTAAGPGQQLSAIETVQSGAVGDTKVPGTDPRMRPNGAPFGSHHRRGSFGGMPPPGVPAPDVPLNAPKGPKAMRQGLPNTSLLKLRQRGFQIPGDEPTTVQSPGVQSATGSLVTPVDDDRDRRRSRSNSIASTAKRREGESDHDHHRERERSSSRSRTGRERSHRDRDRHDRDREGTETRSASRDRSREHRDRKRRSHRSDEEADRDYDKDRRHRHRSSKKYYDDDEPRSSRDDKYGDRSRSASPAESRKSSRRKDRDSEKRRERDRDRDRERGRDRDRDRETEDDRDSKRKSRHRDRDRDHDRSDRSDRDRARDAKDRDRKRDHRDRERDRERDKRRSKHSTAEPPTPTEPSSASEVKEFNPPTGPRGSISKNYSIFNAPKPFETIKGSSKNPPKGPAADRDQDRRSSQGGGPAKDPHAAEREARNRERLLKETQRLAGLGGGLKRRSDDGTDGGRSGKRKRRGGEAMVDDGDEEARMKRLETEREGSRWG